MSFEDYQVVDLDYNENTFTIIRNNGKVHTYGVQAEKDLLISILQHSNEVDINIIGKASDYVAVMGYKQRRGSHIINVRGHLRKK